MQESKLISLANKLTLKFNNLKSFCDRNSIKIVWLLIVMFILFFSLINIWKYFSFQYNALDLAIINQAFYNTSFGQLFKITIHPHSYLGDHLELFILFLTPFYLFFRHPLTLLFLQTIFLGLSAYILYKIAIDKLSKNLSLLITLAFLANPFIHNMNLYEFHILPFAIFSLFLTWFFYEKNRFGFFLLFLLFSLTIREDVALVILMFGALAFVQKKGLKWALIPLILGTFWFVAAIKLTGYFSGYGHYKFIRYYGWLGSDYLSMINNFVTRPVYILKHIFTWHNLAFVAGLFLPFAYLPFFKLKYLIPASLIFLQIIFLSTSGELVLNIHYTALIIPFLFISLIYVFKEIFYGQRRLKIFRIFYNEKSIFIIIFITVIIYSALVIGPIIPVFKNIVNYEKMKSEISLKNGFVNLIPAKAAIAAGFDFLPKVSSREKIYSLHYLYLGKKQYSDQEYTLPNDTEYLLMNLNDFIYYQFLYEQTKDGNNKIRDLIKEGNFGLWKIIDDFVIFKKDFLSNNKVYENNPKTETLGQKNINLDNKIEFIAWQNLNRLDNKLQLSETIFNNKKYKTLDISLFWEALEKVDDNFLLLLTIKNDEKTVYKKLYPIAGGLYPTADWQKGEKIQTNYWFLIPDYLRKGGYEINIQLIKLKADVQLSGTRSMELKIYKTETIGQEINLGQIAL
jgi:uncharacterized membrane protein